MPARLLAILVLASAPTVAVAQARSSLAQVLSPQAFSAYLDLRAIASDKERSELDSGAGKTRNRTDPEYGLTREHGWAQTADYRETPARCPSRLVGVLHVSSDRLARTDILGEPARQTQTVVQASLRVSDQLDPQRPSSLIEIRSDLTDPVTVQLGS